MLAKVHAESDRDYHLLRVFIPRIRGFVNASAAANFRAINFIQMNSASKELHHSDSRMVNYIDRYVTLVGAERKEEVLELFDKMNLFFPHWVIMTCGLMHPDIRYVSPNRDLIFGAPPRGEGETAYDHYANIHEGDIADFKDCISFLHSEFKSIDPAQHHLYRFASHYRYRKPNGQYIYVVDEKASLKLGDGNLYYALYRDVSAEQVFSGVKIEMYRQGPLNEKLKEFKPGVERNKLSRREGQLVTLIRQGLTTKEIAWQLQISHNTVRNIKSRLFEKYNVSNMIELLNMTA